MPSMSDVIVEHTALDRGRAPVAAAGGLGVAAAGRPLVLRPGAVGARHRRERLLGGRADPSDHRADRVAGRRGRGPDRLLPGAPGVRGLPVRSEITQTSAGKLGAGHPGRHPRHPGACSATGSSPWWSSTPTCSGVREPSSLERAYLDAAGGPGRDGVGGRVPDRRATCSTRASILGSGTGSSGWTPTATSSTPARTRSVPTAGSG